MVYYVNIILQLNKRPNPWINLQGMVENPFKVESSSSEHFERSCLETGMGDLRIIAGGELCAVHLLKTKTVQNICLTIKRGLHQVDLK